jgi:hypothetical protein
MYTRLCNSTSIKALQLRSAVVAVTRPQMDDTSVSILAVRRLCHSNASYIPLSTVFMSACVQAIDVWSLGAVIAELITG